MADEGLLCSLTALEEGRVDCDRLDQHLLRPVGDETDRSRACRRHRDEYARACDPLVVCRRGDGIRCSETLLELLDHHRTRAQTHVCVLHSTHLRLALVLCCLNKGHEAVGSEALGCLVVCVEEVRGFAAANLLVDELARRRRHRHQPQARQRASHHPSEKELSPVHGRES